MDKMAEGPDPAPPSPPLCTSLSCSFQYPLLQEAHLDCPGQGPVSLVLSIETRFKGLWGHSTGAVNTPLPSPGNT